MDQNKAELILQLDKHIDCHEAYDHLVFEIKKTILNQGIIPKVLRKRQERLLIIHQAYIAITKKSTSETKNITPTLDGSDWETLFISYEKNKSVLKRQVAVSSDAISIVNALENLILNQKLWSQKFVFDISEVELPTLGKEMDSMEMLSLLKANKTTELNDLPTVILTEFGRILKNLEAEN